MSARVTISVGTRFGKLVVLGEGEPVRYGNQPPSRTLRCCCDCGSVVDVMVRSLRSLGRQQCSKGCAVGARVKHGMARRASRDPIYNCWQSILARCENPKAPGYRYWGGRGIKVYGPWHDPLVFKADVERELGPRLSTDMTVERKDVEGHYWPGNIMWLPKAKQPLNRRRKYDAEEVAELLDKAVAEALAAHHCEGCQCVR